MPIFLILDNFGCSFGQKRPKSKLVFVVEFSFVGKHLYTKFQKILSNSMNFANFLHFWSILAVIWPKEDPKMPKSKKSFFEAFSFVGKHLITKF